MNEHRYYWDELYRLRNMKKPIYDLWLDKYENILLSSQAIPIIDLGCGFGNDTLYLYQKGYKVISCDFSSEALRKVAFFIEKPVIKLVDMTKDLPFASESVKIVIADLSLHYFSWDQTQKIVMEIRRILQKGGYLLARVNSVKDINHGAGQGIIVEDNYYFRNGQYKRFFDKVQLEKLFAEWEILYSDEYEISRYKNSKILWEIAVNSDKLR
jgi:SAM-dependent methyltransferase